MMKKFPLLTDEMDTMVEYYDDLFQDYDRLKIALENGKFNLKDADIDDMLKSYIKRSALTNIKYNEIDAKKIIEIFELYEKNDINVLAIVSDHDRKGLFVNIYDIILREVFDSREFDIIQNYIFELFIKKIEHIALHQHLENFRNIMNVIVSKGKLSLDLLIILERVTKTYIRNILVKMKDPIKDLPLTEKIYFQNTDYLLEHFISVHYATLTKIYPDQTMNLTQNLNTLGVLISIYKINKTNVDNVSVHMIIDKNNSTYVRNSMIILREIYTANNLYLNEKSKNKIREIWKEIIIVNKKISYEVQDQNNQIQEIFNRVFEKIKKENNLKKDYSFIISIFLNVYQNEIYQQYDMLDSNIYSYDRISKELFPKDTPEELEKENTIKYEKEILLAFLDSLKEYRIPISTNLLDLLNKFIEEKLQYLTTEELMGELEVSDKKEEKSEVTSKKSRKNKGKKKVGIVMSSIGGGRKGESESKKGEKETIDDTNESVEEAYKKTLITEIGSKLLFGNIEFNEATIKSIREEFFCESLGEDNEIIIDEKDKEVKFNRGFNILKISQLMIFNILKDYIVYIISTIFSKKNMGEIRKTSKNGGKLILQGGACVQYYSNAKRKTYDLDYKFYPDLEFKDDIKNQQTFFKEVVLPYFTAENFDINQIILSRKIKYEGDDFGMDIKNMLEKIFSNIQANATKNLYNLDFYFDERGIIKFYVANKGKGKSIEKFSLVDISLYTSDEKSIRLIKDTLKNPSAQIPKTFTKTVKKVNIVMLDKEYLQNQIINFIRDCEEYKKDPSKGSKYISEVPGITDFLETIDFIESKMIDQAKCLDVDVKKIIDKGKHKRSIKKRSRSVKRRSRSVKRRSIKKRSVKRRSVKRRSVKKRSRSIKMRRSLKRSKTNLRKRFQ